MNFEDNDFVSQNLSNIFSVSGTVLIYTYSFDELIYQLPEIGNYYSHFTDEKTETKGCSLACLSLQSVRRLKTVRRLRSF